MSDYSLIIDGKPIDEIKMCEDDDLNLSVGQKVINYNIKISVIEDSQSHTMLEKVYKNKDKYKVSVNIESRY